MKSYRNLPPQGPRSHGIAWRSITLASLLASALTVPGSTAAVPSDVTDLDAAPPARQIETPSTPSVWQQPAAPAPVVVKAAAPPAKASEPERAHSANPLWAIPLTTLATTRDRPIFSPSRRPPPPVVQTPVAVAPPPRSKPPKVEQPQLALVGTISGTDQSFGIFVDQTTKTALRLKIGEEYQGWRLRNVDTREVTLEHDELTAVLSLPQPDANAAQPVTEQAANTAPPRRILGQRH